MKKSLFLIAVVFSMFACTTKPSADSAGAGDAQSAAAGSGVSYTLESVSSKINWKGTKPLGEHYGMVSLTDGMVTVEGGKITSGVFTIDLNSIVVQDITDAETNGKLLGHLKSPDFFDVAQFPAARFELTSVSELVSSAENTSKSNYQVSGNLTMKGITKSISFPAQVEISDMGIIAKSEPFSIDRTQWGVNYGSKSIFAELKDNFIDDAMILTLDLSFKK